MSCLFFASSFVIAANKTSHFYADEKGTLRLALFIILFAKINIQMRWGLSMMDRRFCATDEKEQ